MLAKPIKPIKPKIVSNIERRKNPKAKTTEEAKTLTRYSRALRRYKNNLAKWKEEQEREKKLRRRHNRRLWLRHCHDVYLMTLGLLEHKLQPSDQSRMGRKIAVALREIPNVHIPWISKECLKAKAQGILPVQEHIYPLQVDGEILFTHLYLAQEGKVPIFSFRQFVRYARVFLQVAKTTSQENKNLGCYGRESPQHTELFITPEWAYRMVGMKFPPIEVEFTPINRIENVAPKKVLKAFFGDRLKEFHKYSC